MSDHAGQFAVLPGGAASASAPPGRQFQELWLSIARRPWISLVVVPADASLSCGWIATALAEVGTRLRETPVTAIVAEQMDYASARSLCEIQPRLEGGREWDGAVEVAMQPPAVPAEPAPARAAPRREARLLPPFGRVIVAIEAVVEQPLGVAVAHAADAVLVCLRLGETRAKAARRTVELIGADRIVGAVVVR